MHMENGIGLGRPVVRLFQWSRQNIGGLGTKSDDGDEDKFKVDFGSPTDRLNGVREEQKKTLRFLQNCVALY